MSQNKFGNLKINSYLCIKKRKGIMKYNSNWGGLNKADNEWHDAMFSQHVPACGKSKNLGGEILRAINRIVYKFYNDGDTVARYYSSSYNHSFGAEKFLSKHVPGYKPMRDITGDYAFEEAAHENLVLIVNYLRKNPALFEVENTEDFIELSPFDEDSWEQEEDEWDDEDEENY